MVITLACRWAYRTYRSFPGATWKCFERQRWAPTWVSCLQGTCYYPLWRTASHNNSLFICYAHPEFRNLKNYYMKTIRNHHCKSTCLQDFFKKSIKCSLEIQHSRTEPQHSRFLSALLPLSPGSLTRDSSAQPRMGLSWCAKCSAASLEHGHELWGDTLCLERCEPSRIQAS